MVSASCNIKFVMKGLVTHLKTDVFMGGKNQPNPNKTTKRKLNLFLKKVPSASESTY